MKKIRENCILGVIVFCLTFALCLNVKAEESKCDLKNKIYYHSIQSKTSSHVNPDVYSINFYTCESVYTFNLKIVKAKGNNKTKVTNKYINVDRSELNFGKFYGSDDWQIMLSDKFITNTLNSSEDNKNMYVKCDSSYKKCAVGFDEEDFNNSFNYDDVKSFKIFNIYSSGKNNHDSGIKGETEADPDSFNVEEYKPFELGDPNDQKCDTLLGDKDNPLEPAYYVKLAFDIIKYIAIIFLIVFSIIDYFKAVVSKDEDALKTATRNVFKRLIILLILFILPTLILYLFELSGIMDNPELCGI